MDSDFLYNNDINTENQLDELLEDNGISLGIKRLEYLGGFWGGATDSQFQNIEARDIDISIKEKSDRPISVNYDSIIGGAFGYIQSSTVKSVIANNIEITNKTKASMPETSSGGIYHVVGGLFGYALNNSILSDIDMSAQGKDGKPNIKIIHANGDTSDEHNVRTGCVLGQTRDVTINSLKLAHCEAEGTHHVGGVIGGAYNKNDISDVQTYDVKLTGKDNYQVGGIAAVAYDTTLNNVHAQSVMHGHVIVGGLIGTTNKSVSISNSSAVNYMTAVDTLGGIIGRIQDTDNVSLKNNIAFNYFPSSGSLSNDNRPENGLYAGGIIGSLGIWQDFKPLWTMEFANNAALNLVETGAKNRLFGGFASVIDPGDDHKVDYSITVGSSYAVNIFDQEYDSGFFHSFTPRMNSVTCNNYNVSSDLGSNSDSDKCKDFDITLMYHNDPGQYSFVNATNGIEPVDCPQVTALDSNNNFDLLTSDDDCSSFKMATCQLSQLKNGLNINGDSSLFTNLAKFLCHDENGTCETFQIPVPIYRKSNNVGDGIGETSTEIFGVMPSFCTLTSTP